MYFSVHITGLYNGKQFEDRDVKLVLGEGSEADVVLGVELGLKKFKSGEKSKLKIKSEYAYGEKGHNEYNIPPGADLEYEVTLKTFEKVNTIFSRACIVRLKLMEYIIALIILSVIVFIFGHSTQAVLGGGVYILKIIKTSGLLENIFLFVASSKRFI